MSKEQPTVELTEKLSDLYRSLLGKRLTPCTVAQILNNLESMTLFCLFCFLALILCDLSFFGFGVMTALVTVS